jgi:uncharacterized protein with HEPN domain
VSPRSPQVIISEMLDNIQLIYDYVSQLATCDPQLQGPLRDAIVWRLGTIGEAASQLDPDLRARYPNVEWAKIIAMRNRLFHGYFSVDFAIVSDTVQNSLPTLEPQLREILQREP